MKASVAHNLSGTELDEVIETLQKARRQKSLKSVRMPAANPAQAHMSQHTVSTYKKVMIQSLDEHLRKVLETEE